VDIDRIRRAAQDIDIVGIAPGHPERAQVIEAAIAAIQADGSAAFATHYMGVKNYAGFGDQREDHPYGYGPRHGHTVFSVGRYASRLIDPPVVLGADHIYLLECARDFPGAVGARGNLVSLTQVVRYMDELREQAAQLEATLQETPVEAHV
jgi:hypothetical protein